LEAAIRGRGVALAKAAARRRRSRRRRLVKPFEAASVALGFALLHRLPAGESRAAEAAVFRNWLYGEAELSRELKAA